MKKIILIALLAFGLFSTTASASYAEARYAAEDTARFLVQNGWTIKDSDAAYLRAGGHVTYSTTLYAGNTYAFVAVGDSRVKDIDVEVYSASGTLLVRDDSASKEAVATFSPRYTGTYKLKYKMYSGYGDFIDISAWK